MHLLTSHDKKTLINLSQVQTITIPDNCTAIDYEFQPESGERNFYREKFESMDDVDKRFKQIQKINSFINVR